MSGFSAEGHRSGGQPPPTATGLREQLLPRCAPGFTLLGREESAPCSPG